MSNSPRPGISTHRRRLPLKPGWHRQWQCKGWQGLPASFLPVFYGCRHSTTTVGSGTAEIAIIVPRCFSRCRPARLLPTFLLIPTSNEAVLYASRVAPKACWLASGNSRPMGPVLSRHSKGLKTIISQPISLIVPGGGVGWGWVQQERVRGQDTKQAETNCWIWHNSNN